MLDMKNESCLNWMGVKVKGKPAMTGSLREIFSKWEAGLPRGLQTV